MKGGSKCSSCSCESVVIGIVVEVVEAVVVVVLAVVVMYKKKFGSYETIVATTVLISLYCCFIEGEAEAIRNGCHSIAQR